MFKKAMTGLVVALVLSPVAALANSARSNCTPGDTRQCPRTTDPYCYQECTAFGNWTTSCWCDYPAQEDQEQASRGGEASKRLCSELKPAPEQTQTQSK
ncbi:hypothetical protein [Hyalangium gracile]|uniref:hypothetical protein n=1 Tax=Hyalangium gracile TaxID=394092 RepID=UPI001CCAF4ED|nr:hypothetical protein [Hyalangium gracile]